MLTDAEMQRLLDAHDKHGELLSYRVDPKRGEWLAYVLALDAAMPKLVEEVRRLRAEVKELNEYVAVLCGRNPKEESNG